MAYTFDKLQSKIDEEDRAKQDIFAQEGGQGFGLTSQQPGQTSGIEQPVKKTQTGLSLATPAPVQSQQVKPVEQVEAPRGASEQRQQTINTQKTQLPASFSKIGAMLGEKEQGFDPAKQSYLSKYNQQDFGLSPETVSSAIQGDADAMAKVSGRLGQTSPGITADTFEVPDIRTPEIGQIQTQGGLEQYLRRQGGAQYTSGEGSFDASSLNRDAVFNAARSELARRENALQKQYTDLGTSLPDEANRILADRLSTSQGDIRTGLGDEKTEIQKIIDQMVADEQEKLNQSGLARTKNAQIKGNIAAEDLLGRLPPELGIDPEVLRQISNTGTLANQFYDVRDKAVGRGEVATPQQIEQFNRIMDMLGQGNSGQIVAAERDPYTTFDTAGYQQALQEAALKESDRLSQAAADKFESLPYSDEPGAQGAPQVKQREPTNVQPDTPADVVIPNLPQSSGPLTPTYGTPGEIPDPRDVLASALPPAQTGPFRNFPASERVATLPTAPSETTYAGGPVDLGFGLTNQTQSSERFKTLEDLIAEGLA